MDWTLLAKGLALGFSIAAPVGPIGILCLQRTLAQGRLAGFASGLGAATADGLYGLAAALGLGLLSSFLLEHQVALRLVGGLFLLGLGARLAFKKPPPQTGDAEVRAKGLFLGYSTTFLLTLTNPMTILAFSALMAGLGAFRGQALVLVAGIFSGSALWWLFLALVGGFFRERIGPRTLIWINRSAGAAVAGFGTAILILALGASPLP